MRSGIGRFVQMSRLWRSRCTLCPDWCRFVLLSRFPRGDLPAVSAKSTASWELSPKSPPVPAVSAKAPVNAPVSPKTPPLPLAPTATNPETRLTLIAGVHPAGHVAARRPSPKGPRHASNAQTPWQASNAQTPWQASNAQTPWQASNAQTPWQASNAQPRGKRATPKPRGKRATPNPVASGRPLKTKSGPRGRAAEASARRPERKRQTG
jgi:hypothetical protein